MAATRCHAVLPVEVRFTRTAQVSFLPNQVPRTDNKALLSRIQIYGEERHIAVVGLLCFEDLRCFLESGAQWRRDFGWAKAIEQKAKRFMQESFHMRFWLVFMP